MSKVLSGLGAGAATGAALGGALGSIIPGLGTGVGGAIGGVGGGLAGLFAGLGADDDEDKAKHDAIEQAQKDANHARTDAYKRFMLGEAARNGANPTLVAKSAYDSGLDDINYQSDKNIRALNESGDDGFDPMALVPLATAGATVGNNLYKQFGASSVPTDIGMSPEAQKSLDEDNGETLKPLRKGVRMGF